MENESIIKTKFILARNIRYRRMQLGLKQRELGDRIHMDRRTLSQKEHGKTGIDAEHLPQIAQALGVAIADLFEAGKFYRE